MGHCFETRGSRLTRSMQFRTTSVWSTITLVTPALLAKEARAPPGLRPSLRFDTFECLPLPKILFASSSLRFLSRPDIHVSSYTKRPRKAGELTLLDDVVERLASVLVGRHYEGWPVGSFEGTLHILEEEIDV